MTSRKAFARVYHIKKGDTAAAKSANAKGAVANLTALREAYNVNMAAPLLGGIYPSLFILRA